MVSYLRLRVCICAIIVVISIISYLPDTAFRDCAKVQASYFGGVQDGSYFVGDISDIVNKNITVINSNFTVYYFGDLPNASIGDTVSVNYTVVNDSYNGKVVAKDLVCEGNNYGILRVDIKVSFMFDITKKYILFGG